MVEAMTSAGGLIGEDADRGPAGPDADPVGREAESGERLAVFRACASSPIQVTGVGSFSPAAAIAAATYAGEPPRRGKSSARATMVAVRSASGARSSRIA